MGTILVLSAVALVGIEIGWEPLGAGGHEYTIQIEPQLLRVLEEGTDLVSEIPPQLNVRRYRVTVGVGKLKRDDGSSQAAPLWPPTESPPAAVTRVDEAAPGPNFGHQEDELRAASPANDKGGVADTARPVDEQAEIGERASADDVPRTLPASHREQGSPVERPASFQDDAQEHNAEKPALDDASAGQPVQPWMPLVISAVLLCCSLGANLYLGWVAWEARSKYRDALTKMRAA